MSHADVITRRDVINSSTEVRQLVVEDDPGARREDLGAKSVQETHQMRWTASLWKFQTSNNIRWLVCHTCFRYWHVVDGAGDRHSRSILSQHRHVCGAYAVQIWGDVVVAGIMSLVTTDQAPYVVGKAVLCEFPYHLQGVPSIEKHNKHTFQREN